MNKRIGIFSGVFDPVHDGHISFALAAIKKAKLDSVYFLAEPKPRRKDDVTHLAHRVAMLRIATTSQKNLDVLDLPDKQFSVAKTWPRLVHRFQSDELYFLAGTDVLNHMPDWPHITSFIKGVGLVVGIRQASNLQAVTNQINKLPAKPRDLVILDGPKPGASSLAIRQGLAKGEPIDNIHPQVLDYIKANWLYVAPSVTNSSSK